MLVVPLSGLSKRTAGLGVLKKVVGGGGQKRN